MLPRKGRFLVGRCFATTGPVRGEATDQRIVGAAESLGQLGRLTVAPYIRSRSESQLFLTMVGGMATVGSGLLIVYAGMGARIEYVLAASIMGAPAAIVFAKILIPERAEALESAVPSPTDEHGINVLDAVARGAMEGWKAVVGVTVMLLAFISLIHRSMR